MVGQLEAAANVSRITLSLKGALVPRSGTWLVRSCSKKLKLLCPAMDRSMVGWRGFITSKKDLKLAVMEDLELAITGVAGVKRTSELVHGDDLRSWHAIPQELETHTCFTRHHHHHETLEQSINTRPEEW
jgi:hypothetical protein